MPKVKEKDELTVSKGNGSAVKEAAAVVERAMAAAEMKTPDVKLSDELQAKADHVVDAYVGFLNERTEAYATEMAASAGAAPEAGGPIVSGFQYWNVFTRGPYQLTGQPFDRPSRVCAAGEWAMMLGVVWINPVYPSPFVFAGKQARVSFETINLTDVQKGPSRIWNYTFPPAATLGSIHVFRWYFRPNDPGPTPNLYECTLSADLTMAGMPFAAFNSWHHDPEGHPGIPGLTPSIPTSHWQHDIPARFLVYRETL